MHRSLHPATLKHAASQQVAKPSRSERFTSAASHQAQATTPTVRSSVAEHGLLLALGLALLLALVGHSIYPLTPDRAATLVQALGLHAHTGGHVFADTRTLWGVVNAGDVLSNLPFMVFGVWGVVLTGLLRRQIGSTHMVLLGVFFVGLGLTTVGSMAYHLRPDDASLFWDRAGMAVAFAGVLGLAAAERVSHRSGVWTALAVLMGAGVSLLVWRNSADVLPWVVVQFGGMALVVALAFRRSIISPVGNVSNGGNNGNNGNNFGDVSNNGNNGCNDGNGNGNSNGSNGGNSISPSTSISLWTLIAFYALAKVLESSDHAVFELTNHWISGHSLKHIAASLAALPVIRALQSRIHHAP
jgi:hypothetical protein